MAGIGASDQIVERLAAAGLVDGDAHAQLHVKRQSRDLVERAQVLTQASQHGVRVRARRAVREHDEFVSAQPCDAVAVAKAAPQDLRGAP
jgi:ElaB/YqjD/DUF883 family membrane-anchored ribosome-binding protein